LQQQLVSAEDALGEFTYLVCHDVGAPLRAIVNFSKMLKDKYDGQLDEKGSRYLAFITEGGEKAQAMLQALSQYSRLATGELSPAYVDCEMAVEQCRVSLRDKLNAAGARILMDPLPT